MARRMFGWVAIGTTALWLACGGGSGPVGPQDDLGIDTVTTDPGRPDDGGTDPGIDAFRPDPGQDPGTPDSGPLDPGIEDPGHQDPGTEDPGESDSGSDATGTDLGPTDPGPSDPGLEDTHDAGTDIWDPECTLDDDCLEILSPETCEVARCDRGLCVLETAVDLTPCDDGTLCTQDAVCVEGLCEGLPVNCPDDDDPCTLDVCVPGTGCQHLAYTGDCDDGNACTENDTCATGTCQGTALVCADENECTQDGCDPLSGCTFVKLTGTVCNDQDPCTDNDRCNDGVCGGAWACDDGNACTEDSCIPGVGCLNTPIEGPCNDGNACTVDDACVQGECRGTTRDCDDDNICTDDSCDPAVGCLNVANALACDDEDPCTHGDTCSGKQCAGVPYQCVASECLESSTCDGRGGCIDVPKDDGTDCADDGDDCTLDRCEDGVCVHPTAPDGAPCDDGDLCSQEDRCEDGVCTGSDWVDCPVDDPCRDAGTCDPATGECTAGVLPEGAPCNDRNACTRRDVCRDNSCTGEDPVICTALSQCHDVGTCNVTTGLCSNPRKLDGTGCNDGNLCTLTDQCLEGVCVGSAPVVCPEPGQCELPSTCNPQTGTCPVLWKDNNTPCDDGTACTKNDVCKSGACSGTAYTCVDSYSCTDNVCDGQGGCLFPVRAGTCLIGTTCRNDGYRNVFNVCQICRHETNPNGWSNDPTAVCSDNIDCTHSDSCVDGTCQGTAYSCDDGLSCTEDQCRGDGGCDHYLAPGFCAIDNACWAVNQPNPANTCQWCVPTQSTGAWTPKSAGDSCNDGNPCTHTDQCTGGVCVGTPYQCANDLPCTQVQCNGQGGCTTTILPDYCVIDGACIPDGQANPDNICQTCIARSNQQGWSAASETTPCDDDDPCTTRDRCIASVCVGTMPTCFDGLGCTQDVCDEGVCSFPVDPDWCAIDGACWETGEFDPFNGCRACDADEAQTWWTPVEAIPCDDGNNCTLEDTCLGGSCVGTPMDCDDGLVCTTDGCSDGACRHSPAPGHCFIQGVCYVADEINPDNICQKCDPPRVQTVWGHNNGATCDDGNACTFDDTCNRGGCDGTTYGCDDGLACTMDVCTGDGGCDFVVQPGFCLIEGRCYQAGDSHFLTSCKACMPLASQTDWTDLTIPCDDGNACSKDDVCQDGFCTGLPYVCDDGISCTTDRCDGLGGCSYAVQVDKCLIGGVCRNAYATNPANVCQVCLPSLSQTSWRHNDGAACDDGVACTLGDYCLGGACNGLPYVCDDGLFCTNDICNGAGGCTFQRQPEYCLIQNQCVLDGERNPANTCQECDAVASPTTWIGISGPPCNDGNACTLNDVCTSGACVGTLHPCDDGVVCTADICDGMGGCSFPLAPGWCRIQGVCWPQGAPKPNDTCQACVPQASTSDWTVLDVNEPEICNGIDDNCDGITDPENTFGCVFYYVDADEDGFGNGGIPPRCLCAPEGNYRATVAGDCNDDNPSIHPGATEICDWVAGPGSAPIDNDCDGLFNPEGTMGCAFYHRDNDGDGHGVPGDFRCLCEPQGVYRALSPTDCNDNNPYAWLGALEICDGHDNDCDGQTDPEGALGCSLFYRDADGDGFGVGSESKCLCGVTGEYSATRAGDCDDGNPDVNPDAFDACNGINDDCVGGIDDAPLALMCPTDPGANLHGSVACLGGSCQLLCNGVVADPPQGAWHDNDGVLFNGCECQDDAYSVESRHDVCSSARDLGEVKDDGGVRVVQANLAAPGTSDWWRIRATDLTPTTEPDGCDKFNFKVIFLDNPGDGFRIDAFRGGCQEFRRICSNGTTVEWATNFRDASGRGECACSPHQIDLCDPPEDLADCIRRVGIQNCGSCPGMGQPNANLCTDNSEDFYIRVFRKAGAAPTCANYRLEFSNGKYPFSGN